ncbi:MAG: universal stress protein [Cyclobacteriaceae bacterium]|nr:universal stress protein [Cyclobacteriaceae bacterium]
MEEIKRVLVALDLTEMDETLVQYVAMLSNNISLDKVYFFSVLKNLELPDAIAKKYPDLVAPLDEATTKEIQYTVDEASGNQLKANYEITVTEGNRAEQILKWARIKEVDLIVLGRKSGLEGEGIVSGKVIKLAPCSVIMVPEVLPQSLKKIVIPIDFSVASKLAFEFSLNLYSNIPGLKITCLNIFDVPSGYSVSGKSYEEFAEIMKHNAKESFDEFFSEYDTKGTEIETKFELDENGHIAKKIYQFSVKEKASAIVMGSKGRTQAAAVLIGSIAEKLIKLNAQLPLIVVKERRHNMGFLEALLKI